MRLSLNWLKEYVEIEMSPQKLADLLTMAGLEVEGIEPIGQSIQGVVAAKILGIEKHPQADRLSICHMDAGSGDIQVVCGAPNLTEGAIVPMALPGSKLPNGMVIKEGKFRGEISKGMLLAEDELELTDDHTGIMILDSNIEPGIEITECMNLKDFAFDISLTPNRPDCASVIGISREVAALTGQSVSLPEIKYPEEGPPITELAKVTIEDIIGCPRYAAGMVQDIELKPSPFWMRYRLYVSDVRAINNIVDITNYVLMELGQPLHAFDYERLRGHQIIVARAKNGDTFSTLDGQTHTLNSGHLMICDGERQVAMAGVMGGLNSEIFEGSKNVLIESAYFDPTTIRRGAKSVGLSTEASYRFERGIDIGGVERALRRTLMFISELAGGKVNKGIIDVYPEPKILPLIDLRVTKANEFLGTSISKESIAGYLTALDMSIQDLDEETFRVQPPSFRVDLTREIDIIEEIARLEGYDNIPVTYPAISHSDAEEIPSLILRDKISDIMTGLGFSEIITYSFISPDSVDLLGASDSSVLRSFVKLQNPLSIEQSVMRTSLLPGLLSTVRDNYAYGETEIMIYEWGNIFINRKDNDLPSENLFFSAVMTGNYENDDLYHRTRKVDFYDMKGAVEILLETIGFTGVLFKRENSESWYDPDIFCNVYDSDTRIGSLGLVNSDVLERFDIKAKEVYICEVDIEALMEQMKGKSINFSPYSRFPAVVRDLSIIVDKGIESVRIRDIIRKEGRGLIESVKVFDVYEGEKVGNLKKALSFRICYRSKDSTLDGKVVNRLHDSVIKKVIKETGGALKEG